MKQDFHTFDQSPKGWRSLENGTDACTLTIAMLIDSYHLGHQFKLKPYESRLSYWHAGQSYGFLKLYNLAILRLSNSFDPEEGPKPEFHWNAYARATIAFLKKDKAALLAARDEFDPVAPMEMANLKIVDRFIRGFESSYFDAYAGVGTCVEEAGSTVLP